MGIIDKDLQEDTEKSRDLYITTAVLFPLMIFIPAENQVCDVKKF